ncbi:MAG: corrinoid protein [Lachnospiraceae bacterium]|nr:corrinoid protein [Lachnospiraceae bacterium]
MDTKELYEKIAEGVVEMEEDTVVEYCQKALDEGLDAADIIREGLIKGMDEVSRLYETGEYFLPEVLTASYALNEGVNLLKPHLKKEVATTLVKVVIGVVEGDTHDIGKNLVKIMCESAGFEVYDMGRDVPIDDFIDKAVEVDADFICLSTLMTTTMQGMKDVVEHLKERGLRDRFKVMIGGGPVSQKFCDEIGADGYSADAASCVRKMKEMMAEKAWNSRNQKR